MGDDNQVVPTMKEQKVFSPLIFNKELKDMMKSSRVLIIGAGGIGCELLKNLVLTGFEDIEIIDLDTIDVSNLNRQFLFHKKHVGMPKVTVARDSALSLNPNAKIVAHYGSIISPDFGVSYIATFKIVLSALDNKTARYHVNRLCLAANVPLVESGTSGYFGQVELIKKKLTNCYECFPSPAPKTFPGCTIRNTPSELIHCIVWAKHLFNQLFGEQDSMKEDEDVSPDPEDQEAQLAGGALNKKTISTRDWAKEIEYDGAQLFKKFFSDDIHTLLSMKKLWESRNEPQPLLLEDAKNSTKASEENVENNSTRMANQLVWSISKCTNVFMNCVNGLKKSLEESTHGYLVWDKDDKLAMEFVASTANIRAHVFGITQKSLFDVQAMAGNIVPAIATSNAIVAGSIVIHALNVLRQEFDQCHPVYVRENPNPRGFLTVRETTFLKPNPKCTSCSEKPMVTIGTDLSKMKLKEFDSLILKDKFNMIEPEVILVRTGNMILSSDEGETDDLKEKTLFELGVTHGSLLEADDFIQDYKILIIMNQRDLHREDPPFLVLDKAGRLAPKVDTPPTKEDSTKKNGSHHDSSKAGPSEEKDERDCLMIIDGVEHTTEQFSRKRKLQTNSVPVKKRKADDDPVIL